MCLTSLFRTSLTDFHNLDDKSGQSSEADTGTRLKAHVQIVVAKLLQARQLVSLLVVLHYWNGDIQRAQAILEPLDRLTNISGGNPSLYEANLGILDALY